MVKTKKNFYFFTILFLYNFVFFISNASPIQSLDFRLSQQGHILIEAQINNEGPFTLALDTGGGKTIISPTTGLFGPSDGELTQSRIQGPIKKRDAQNQTLSSIAIGKLTETNLNVAVMPLNHLTNDEYQLHGVLGQDFLNGYDFEIDFPNRKIRFYQPAQTMETCEVCNLSGNKVSFENDFGGLIRFEITLNELTLTSLLDTGSGLTTINKSAVFGLGLDMDTLRANDQNKPGNRRRTDIRKITRILEREQRRQRGERERNYVVRNGNDTDRTEFRPSRVKEYRIPISAVSLEGNIIKRHQSIAFIDLPVFRQMGFNAKPIALIGNDLFQDKVLRISNGMKMLSLSNSELLLIDP